MQSFEKSPSNIKPNVIILVCSNRPSKFLLYLLDSIARQTAIASIISVLIVDSFKENRSQQDFLVLENKLPLKWIKTDKTGFSSCRNLALEYAGECINENAIIEYLAWVDDDEILTPHWLEMHLSVMTEIDADILNGKVITQYGEQVYSFIKKIRLLDHPQRGHLEPIKEAYTSNSFMRADLLSHGVRFDSKFNSIGGEDTHFFNSLNKLGCRIYQNELAVVFEHENESYARLFNGLRKVFIRHYSLPLARGYSVSQTLALAIIRMFIGFSLIPIFFILTPFDQSRVVRFLIGSL